MQFQPVTHGIEMFGVEDTREMGIAATGKVFYAFISGLYSRKIEAVVRETCANARDGHLKKGNVDQSFDVHAPTEWEPFYRVRDYGCGMTHDFVMNLYSVIGVSTKESSNLEVGTWGFGSKSPYAYAAQFSVACWLDGEKRTYNLHLDAKGTPTIALMDRSPSDEPDGVEVSIAVKQKDFEAFADQIRWAAMQHPVAFVCNIEAPPAQRVADHAEFYEVAGLTNGPYVEIGCVWYKVEPAEVPGFEAVLAASQSIVFKTAIGDLAVPPSRETLEYTDHTRLGLEKILRRTEARARRHAAAFVAALPTLWGVATATASDLHPLTRRYIRETKTPWGTVESLETFSTRGTKIGEITADPDGTLSHAFDMDGRIVRKPGTFVYIHDPDIEQKAYLLARIKHHMRVNEIAHGVILYKRAGWVSEIKQKVASLSTTDRDVRRERMATFKETLAREIEAQNRFVADYGCPDVVCTSTLETAPRSSGNRKKIQLYSFRYRTRVEKAYEEDWERLRKPAEKGLSIVVPLTHGNSRADERYLRICAKEIGETIGSLIGVARSNLARFLDGSPGWHVYSDIFSKDTIDPEPFIERLRTIALHSTPKPSFWRLHEIERRIPPGVRLPLVDEYRRRLHAANDAFDALGIAANHVIKGLSADECRGILTMLEVEIPVIRPPDLCSAADATYQRIMTAYPCFEHRDIEEARERFFGAQAYAECCAVALHSEQLELLAA